MEKSFSFSHTLGKYGIYCLLLAKLTKKKMFEKGKKKKFEKGHCVQEKAACCLQ